MVAWFKEHAAADEGFQTWINRALREYVRGQTVGKVETPRR